MVTVDPALKVGSTPVSTIATVHHVLELKCWSNEIVHQ